MASISLPSLLFHFTAVCVFAYGIYYDVVELQIPESYKKRFQGIDFAGKWKYLTFWNAVLQLIYFVISLINDLIGDQSQTHKEKNNLQIFRDYIFGSVTFPLALFVSTTFWGLWAVDRELVFPAALDLFYPSWLNHIMHSSIVPFALTEMIFIPRTFPSQVSALTGLVSVMLAYVLWIFYIAWKTDFWVYPVFAVLHWSGRLVFILALILLALAMYYIGEKLFYAAHGQHASGVKIKKTTRADKKNNNKNVTKRKQAGRS